MRNNKQVNTNKQKLSKSEAEAIKKKWNNESLFIGFVVIEFTYVLSTYFEASASLIYTLSMVITSYQFFYLPKQYAEEAGLESWKELEEIINPPEYSYPEEEADIRSGMFWLLVIAAIIFFLSILYL